MGFWPFPKRTLVTLVLMCLATAGCSESNPTILDDRVIVYTGLRPERFTELMSKMKAKGFNLLEKRRYVFTADARLIISTSQDLRVSHKELARGAEVFAAGTLLFQMAENPIRLTQFQVDNDSQDFCSSETKLKVLAQFLRTLSDGGWQAGMRADKAPKCA